MSKQDYYETLGLAKSATEDDIKKSYRKLAMKYHPDRNQGADSKQAEEKFKEAKEAYECLSDPQRRSMYDAHGHAASDPNFGKGNTHQWTHNGQGIDPAQFRDIFGGMFGDVFGSHYNQPQKQRHIINISLEDAYKGKQIKLPDGMYINIPAGVRPGTKFMSETAIYEIGILPHSKFKRANDDLLIDVEISAIEAMLSVEVTLDHLDGSKLQFTIPTGIQNGQVVRLGGKGLRNPELNKQGDLMVRITVTTPRGLTDKEIEFLKTMKHRTAFNI